MAKPIILTVDDDVGGVAGDHPGSPVAVRRAGTASSGRRRAPRRWRRSTSWPPRDLPVALDRLGPRMPEMTGIELLERVAAARARRQARAAHRLRRHRRGDQGDQRHRSRPLPDEAVGAAGGAAVPGARRPARRVGPRQRPALRRRPGGRQPLVGAQLRHADVPRPQPRRLPMARARARRRGAAAARAVRRRGRRRLPLVLLPDGTSLRGASDVRARRRARAADQRRVGAVRRRRRRCRSGRTGRGGVRGRRRACERR